MPGNLRARAPVVRSTSCAVARASSSIAAISLRGIVMNPVARLRSAKGPGHKARTPRVVRRSPNCPVTKPPSHLCHGGKTELIALRVGHDDIVVLGIAIVSHDLRADSDEPFDLARLVIGIQVQVHLIAGGNWRPGELKRDIHVL